MRLCVPVTAFVQNCRPRGSDVNTEGSDTLVGRLRKAGMYPAFIYLFIYFINFFFFFHFFVRVSLECKDVEDCGSINVYQAASFWTVYFSLGTRAGSDHD